MVSILTMIYSNIYNTSILYLFHLTLCPPPPPPPQLPQPINTVLQPSLNAPALDHNPVTVTQ